MIHFRCDCGRTLSAVESLSGSSVSCGACGADIAVPRPVANANSVRRNGAREAAHDFDAEIVGAVRSAPRRPLKTPSEVKHTEPVAQSAVRTPAFDLLVVRRAPRTLTRISWAALSVIAGAAVAAWLLSPWGFWTRGVAALVLLTMGGAVFFGLQALAEVCRSVDGLAVRQRELAERILERRDGPRV